MDNGEGQTPHDKYFCRNGLGIKSDPLTEKLDIQLVGDAWMSFTPGADIVFCSGENEVMRLTPADQTKLLQFVRQLLDSDADENGIGQSGEGDAE